VNFVAPGTSGNVLTSNGTTWTSAAVPAPTPTIATTAEAQAGTNNTNFITPLRLEEALKGGNQLLSTSANGYQRLPGGLIIQWGRCTPRTSTSFPITFPNGIYAAPVGSWQTPVGSARGIECTALSSSAFTLREAGDGAITTGLSITWIAIGH